jgi:Tol biopolymer transport system component
MFASSSGIALLTVADSRVAMVPGGPFNLPLPSWSADGRFILLLDRTKDGVSVCQLDPKSGRRQVLFTIGGNLGAYRVSNHGDRIVFGTIEETTGQFVFSVWDAATHTVRELPRITPSGRMEIAGWSPDDQEVIVSRSAPPTIVRPQGDVELLAFNLNGAAPRSLGWLRVHGDDRIIGVTLSPTGTRLRFKMGPLQSTTWAMEGFLGTAKPAGR